MNYLIDPDVLQAAFDDFSCMASLNKIMTEVQVHRFYKDTDTIIELEYRRIFNEYRDREDHVSIGLLQRLLFEDGNSEDTISSQCIVRDLIELGDHLFPVEPELIGMMANARAIGLTLMLVGSDNLDSVRPRRLHNPEFCRSIGRKIPWLEVEWASRARVDIPRSTYRDTDFSATRAREFESRAALWLQDQDPHLRCITPPPKGQVGGEEIDIYGYRYNSDETTAVIGECKLRREGNETEKPVKRSEIQQLRRKLIAAREYERARKRSPNDMDIPTKYEGVLVSNANELDDEARSLMEEEKELILRVLGVELSSGWETQHIWKILSGHVLFSNQAF